MPTALKGPQPKPPVPSLVYLASDTFLTAASRGRMRAGRERRHATANL